jgi:hypothetical protein
MGLNISGIALGKSLTYKRKSKGPSMAPLGTQQIPN